MRDDDSELLRRYADERSEPAFAELVRRHLDLVYSVALRQVGGDTHLAKDVAQLVFTALARKSGELARRPVLGGWLYRVTQFAAIDAVRSESRRRAKESEAQIMNELVHEPGAQADWEKLRPTLDQVIGELKDDDRDAVVLRFLEGKSFADVGAKLRLTENAARMRVERALDKLHALLARRGVTSTTGALALALTNQVAVAAPAGLGATVTGAALAGGAALGTGSAGAVATLLTFMSTGKILLGLAGIAAVVALGTAFTTAGQVREAEVKLSSAASGQATLDTRVADLEKRVEGEAQRVRIAEAENARLLRAAAEQKAAGAVVAEEPVTSDVVQERMNRARQLVRSGDYAEALKELSWLYDVGMKRTMGPVRLSFGVSLFAELADKYPPAREALDERREAARKKMLADEGDFDAMSEYGAISRVLKDGATMIALLEQFPAGDRRRAELARSALDDLVQARRYVLALEGRKFSSMMSLFEIMSRDRPGSASQTEESRRQIRESVIKNAARDVEVLAGADEVADARTMVNRLLAYDSSEGTQTLVRQHLARAGRPNLMSSPNP